MFVTQLLRIPFSMSDQQNMVLLLSLLRLSLSLLNVFYVILRRKSLNILHASDAKNE